jgi:ABC-type glycerol-3-phosphate transport system permease component
MSRLERRGESRVGAAARVVVLAFGAFVAVAPLVYIVLTSFRESHAYFASPLSLPTDPTLANYRRALDLDVDRWFVSSLVVSAGAVLLSTGLALLAGYAFVRLRFPGAGGLLTVIVGLMLIPPIVLLVPLFVVMSDVGLIGHRLSVVLAYAALTFPFSVFMVVRSMDAIPQQLFETAAMDGARHLQVLRQVVVPLARPVLITILIVNTLFAWNELLIASVFLQGGDSLTLQAGLALLEGRFKTEVPLVFAGAVLSMLPILGVVAIGQRQFVEGMVEGSVKG